MFCWGTHRGGRLWCDYLSEKGKGDYLEIQAGCTPTQLHGYFISAGGEICFSQFFGCAREKNPALLYAPWDEARSYVEKLVEENLPSKTVMERDQKNRSVSVSGSGELLHIGSGWGALELKRRTKMEGKMIPKGFCFPECSLGSEQLPWLSLLETGVFPSLPQNVLPLSYITDPVWKPLLEKSMAVSGYSHNALINCLAVLLYENNEQSQAELLWKKAADNGDPLALRNLACIFRIKKDNKTALSYMRLAFEAEKGRIDQAFTEEYLQMLVENQQFETAWNVFKSLPPGIAERERVEVTTGQAAVEIGEYDFVRALFQKEFTYIKEGETTISDLWFRLQALELAQVRGIPYTEKLLREAVKTLSPPKEIDFRMYDAPL
jgi:hypothetical protein